MCTLKVKILLVCSLTLSFWLIFAGLALAQDPIRVTVSGDPAADGSDWTTQATTLQHALAIAGPGDEIWVASGVYTPGLTENYSFTLTSGIALYGGFAATETLRSQRDWTANLTILSGDIGGDDITDANGVVTDTDNIRGSNSDRIVHADGESSTPITASTILDGFTVTAGQADAMDYPDSVGGGFYCAGVGSGHDCSPSLSNLIFVGNWAEGGGAMFNNGSNQGSSSPSLNNVTFTRNWATAIGGAMVNSGYEGTSSPSLNKVTFIGNLATLEAGAMYNVGYTDDRRALQKRGFFQGIGVKSPKLTLRERKGNGIMSTKNDRSRSRRTPRPIFGDK